MNKTAACEPDPVPDPDGRGFSAAHENRTPWNCRPDAPQAQGETMAGDEDPPEPEDHPAPPAKRVVGRPFPAGNNLNPGGRPKTDARVKAALERLTPTAVTVLKRLLTDPQTPRRVRAQVAMYVVDRRIGKPTMAVSGADGQPLFPGAGAPGGSVVDRLFAAVRAHRGETPAPEGQEDPQPENAPPGPSGEAGKGLPS